MDMFKWKLTFKFLDGTQETIRFEPLIWYEEPKMFVDIEGKFLTLVFDRKPLKHKGVYC